MNVNNFNYYDNLPALSTLSELQDLQNNEKFIKYIKKVDMVNTSYAYNNLKLASNYMESVSKNKNQNFGETVGGTLIGATSYAKTGLICLIDLVHSVAVALISTILAGICLGQVKCLNDATWKYWNHSYIAGVGIAASVIGYAGGQTLSKEIIDYLGNTHENAQFVQENPKLAADILKLVSAGYAKIGESIPAA